MNPDPLLVLIYCAVSSVTLLSVAIHALMLTRRVSALERRVRRPQEGRPV